MQIGRIKINRNRIVNGAINAQPVNASFLARGVFRSFATPASGGSVSALPAGSRFFTLVALMLKSPRICIKDYWYAPESGCVYFISFNSLGYTVIRSEIRKNNLRNIRYRHGGTYQLCGMVGASLMLRGYIRYPRTSTKPET